MARFESPQVLVLGGGGILGEAWMTAVLAGLAEASGFDPRDCDGFVGTSAGAIVATALSAGVEPSVRLRFSTKLPARRKSSAEKWAGGRFFVAFFS